MSDKDIVTAVMDQSKEQERYFLSHYELPVLVLFVISSVVLRQLNIISTLSMAVLFFLALVLFAGVVSSYLMSYLKQYLNKSRNTNKL